MHFTTIATTMAVAATTVSGLACPVPPNPTPVVVYDPVWPTPSVPEQPPTEQPGSSTSVCIDGRGRSWQPDVYDISPADPDRTSTVSKDFNVYNLSNDVKNQVVVFRNIPSTAYNCRVDWTLSWPRNGYHAVKNHDVIMTALSEVPETFSASTVEPLVNQTERAWVTFHKQDEKEESVGGSAGFPPCYEQLAYIASINTDNGGEGSILLPQDEKNGLVMVYNC